MDGTGDFDWHTRHDLLLELATSIMFAVVALGGRLVVGRVTQEFEWSSIGIIPLLVAGAAALMMAMGLHPAWMAVFALVDVGLVLKIFKGDLKICQPWRRLPSVESHRRVPERMRDKSSGAKHRAQGTPCGTCGCLNQASCDSMEGP